jgi:hypothetical protein
MKDMVLLNSSRLEIIIILIKQRSISLEHALCGINNGDVFLLYQCLHCLPVSKDVLLMEAKFHLIERSVTGVLFVASDIEHEFHFFKVLHFDEVRRQTENVVLLCPPQLLIAISSHFPGFPFINQLFSNKLCISIDATLFQPFLPVNS